MDEFLPPDIAERIMLMANPARRERTRASLIFIINLARELDLPVGRLIARSRSDFRVVRRHVYRLAAFFGEGSNFETWEAPKLETEQLSSRGRGVGGRGF